MPSIPRYTKYIVVKPKLLRLNAPYIKKQVAIKKKMYAQNIGGFGEYHIKINDATRLDTIPITSQQNLVGLDMKSSLIHCNVDFLPIRAIGTYLFVTLHQGNFFGAFFVPHRNKIAFVHKTYAK